MKICSKCGEEKLEEDFYNNQRGKRCWCISCCCLADKNKTGSPRSGVYIVKRDNEVLYVGETSNIDRRIKAHRFAIGGEILFISCNDRKERLKLEKELIDKFNPMYNGNLPTKDMIHQMDRQGK